MAGEGLSRAPGIVDDARFVTPALLPILGLLLAVDATALASENSARTQGGSAESGSPAKEPAAAKPAKAEPAAAKPVHKPIPLPPPPMLPARSEEELAKGELLLEQKCSKCHDLSWAFAAKLSDAQWRGHMKRMDSRPGTAISEKQAKQIQRALQSRRARSASR